MFCMIDLQLIDSNNIQNNILAKGNMANLLSTPDVTIEADFEAIRTHIKSSHGNFINRSGLKKKSAHYPNPLKFYRNIIHII